MGSDTERGFAVRRRAAGPLVPTLPAGQGRARVVLLVEDSAADADLAREALAGRLRPDAVHVVRDGAEALAFLRREGAHAGAPRPDLVLLDLNLPDMDGRGVLREIRGDPDLRGIAVVILSSSAAPEDVLAAYRSGANCYVTKPLDLPCYMATVRAIVHYWLEVVPPPAREW